MVGLGETRNEVLQVMDDLRSAEVDFLTIGQYLQPTPKHHAVERFVTPDEFEAYAAVGARQGVPAGFVLAADPLLASCGRRFCAAEGGAAGARRALTGRVHGRPCRPREQLGAIRRGFRERRSAYLHVIPAKAGIQGLTRRCHWTRPFRGTRPLCIP